MSFAVSLYHNTSPLNKVDKSISLVLSVTGSLREDSSVLDPIITIEGYLAENQLARVNYMYIPEFKRYYLITDIVFDITGLCTVSGHVDVLMTYKNEIRAQNAIVSRQEFVYNMYLDDGWFYAYQKPLVFTHPFSVSAPFANHSYVLILAGS